MKIKGGQAGLLAHSKGKLERARLGRRGRKSSCAGKQLGCVPRRQDRVG